MAKVLISADKFEAVIFDMDGVVTKTAVIHMSAWKDVFDALLKERERNNFTPFSQDDYLNYVDGKAREDGIRSFLQSRKISLPEGNDDDDPGLDSVTAVAKLKNQKFLEIVNNKGVEPYETTVALIRALKKRGIRVALVTASKNGQEVLKAANLSHIFNATVDGVDAQTLSLPGKPNPDMFVEAALRLGISPKNAVVVEDAAAGVEAGHRGRFGLTIGVARSDDEALLKRHGADIVVDDLGQVTVEGERNEENPGMAMSDLEISDDNWVLTFSDYSPDSEKKRESVCTLGNGYFFTRGAAPEAEADETHYPATYIAGLYDRAALKAGKKAYDEEQLINLPNWLSLRFKFGGREWFDLSKVEILAYKQKLDMRAGTVQREITFRHERERETTIRQRWFVHMTNSHLAGLETRVIAHNWSGTMIVRSALDGRVSNGGTISVNEPTDHLDAVDFSADSDGLFLHMRTRGSRIEVAEAARTSIFNGDKKVKASVRNIKQQRYVAQEFECEIVEGDIVNIEKIVAVFSSKDHAIYECGHAARQALTQAPDFLTLLNTQILAWRDLWRQFDLFIETTEEHSRMLPSLLLHLNSFHVLQTGSPNTVDLDVGLPSRGWTGEGYQGHIFWDDLFVFPFLNLRTPDVTEAYLKYRFRRLDEAREIAKTYGARGARFPWQSASSGREETQFIWLPKKKKWIVDKTHFQVHVNADIAYNIWQYYQVTNNLDFMHSYGSEILLEIARFFATFAKYNKRRDRYEIHGVVGPDEWHTNYPDSDESDLVSGI